MESKYHDIKLLKNKNALRGYNIVADGAGGIPASTFEVRLWENHVRLKKELSQAKHTIARLRAKIYRLEGKSSA
jgi:hypothetical protein